MFRSILASACLAVAAALPAALSAHTSTPMAGSAMMKMPTCKTGDTVVWVNTRSKAYYTAGASYYGKTKHGKYVCLSDAMAAGDHAAGATHAKHHLMHGAGAAAGRSGGVMPGSMGTETAAPGGAASGPNVGASPNVNPGMSPGPNATGSLKTNEIPQTTSSSSPSP